MIEDWLFSWKVKFKLRQQWLTDVDRDLVYASSKGFRHAASQLVSHASPRAKAFALWQASYFGHIALQKLLVENDANYQAYWDGLLCRTAEQGDIVGIHFALEQGANLHNNNDLPLYLAGSNGHEKATQDLIHLGAIVQLAFNIHTIAQAKENGKNNGKAMELIEWLFFNTPNSTIKKGIGFKPPGTCEK